MNPRIIPKDAGSIVNAVKDLYFLKYGTSPREIGVQIKKRGERQQNMNIRWLRDTSSRWPEPVDLPFMLARWKKPFSLLSTSLQRKGLLTDRPAKGPILAHLEG
ncbi:MAG: hypothetical protein LQ352_003691 [Teloschistes flavicans]|nr:MAG: hypothetical protein LQ352_003691 [Teloschistes flavicans]